MEKQQYRPEDNRARRRSPLEKVRNAAVAALVLTALAVEVAPEIKVQPQHVEPLCSQLFNPVACNAVPETPTATQTRVVTFAPVSEHKQSKSRNVK